VGRSLQSRLQRVANYGRIGFDWAPDNEVYITANIGQVKTNNQPIGGMNRPNLTIQCANPFVPASVQAACATAGITNFVYGTSNAALGNTQVYTDRRQYRFVAGAKGRQSVAGSDWTYDMYYEHGTNYSNIDVNNVMLSNRFNQAINATTLNGAIVCAIRSPVRMGVSRSTFSVAIRRRGPLATSCRTTARTNGPARLRT